MEEMKEMEKENKEAFQEEKTDKNKDIDSNYQIKKAILEKIREYDTIILSRHRRPDGDAVGSTKGMQRILQLSFPAKRVILQNEDFSDYLSFLGPEEPVVDAGVYGEALVIVLDTATTVRVSNNRLPMAREIIKIDHHIVVEDYGVLNWVEDWRSSACEMVTDFYRTFSDTLKIDVQAATCLFAGMVTDSGRFMYSSTGGTTMELAGLLLNQGVDTTTLYANLYLTDLNYKYYEARIFRMIRLTENGVAHLHITGKTREEFNLSLEDACTAVSFMDSIKGSIVWIAFIDYPDGSIRVRLRSRFIAIDKLANRYNGGGHENASGATIHSISEKRRLLAEADGMVKAYKAHSEGWL